MSRTTPLDPPLRPEDESALKDAIRRINLAPSIHRAARVLLALRNNPSSRKVAIDQMVSRNTIAKIIRQYQKGGVASVLTSPRGAGKPPLTQETVAQIRTLGEDAALSVEKIAAISGVSVGSVSMILQRRRRSRTTKQSSDPKPAVIPSPGSDQRIGGS